MVAPLQGRRSGLIAGLMLACGGGANPETLVDELRVVAIVAEPPEVAPDESFTLTAHIADPQGTAAHAGAWTCLGFGGVCLEEGTDRLVRTSEVSGQVSWPLTAPSEAYALLADQDSTSASLWMMVCEEGLCPLLEDDEPCEDDMEDPFSMLESLPLTGVSLARRSLWISTRSPEERRQNPTIEADFSDTVQVAPEQAQDLCFHVEGATEGYGYASAGGFSETEVEVEDGVLTLTYNASEKTGPVDLWVVVQSDEGASSVWKGSVEVQ